LRSPRLQNGIGGGLKIGSSRTGPTCATFSLCLALVFKNSLCHQKRRKHLLPIFFAHFRRGIDRHTSLGFEPITAFRAGPKIKNQMLANEFRPIRRNQRLTTFGTVCHHGDLLGLFLYSASRVGSFWYCYSRVSNVAICIDTDQNEGSFAPLRALHCGGCFPNLEYRSITHSKAALGFEVCHCGIGIQRPEWR